MRKLYIFGLIGLAAIIIGLAWADQMTFTTYYPAPYGVYNNMRVMNSLGVGTTDPGTARVAVIGGNVGIETTEPDRNLDVAGSIRGDYVDFKNSEYQEASPAYMPDTEEGRMCYDKNDKKVKYWNGSAWAPFGAVNKIIYGGVNADGTVSFGTGFSSTRTSRGYYTITFTDAFSSTPAVTVDVCQGAIVGGVSLVDFPTTTEANIVITGTAARTDRHFDFIAIGN